MLSDDHLTRIADVTAKVSRATLVGQTVRDMVRELQQRRAQRCETCRFHNIEKLEANDRVILLPVCDKWDEDIPPGVTGCVGGWQAKDKR